MNIYRDIDRGEARENVKEFVSLLASGVSTIMTPTISSNINKFSATDRYMFEQTSLGKILTTKLGLSQFLIDLESVRTYLNSTDITRLETEKFIINDDDELQALQNYFYSVDLLLKWGVIKSEMGTINEDRMYDRQQF